MISFLWVLACNALVASGLAVLALLAARWRARPALTHALWLLVLVKLATPPLVPVPVEVAAWPTAPATATVTPAEGGALSVIERMPFVPNSPPAEVRGERPAHPTAAAVPAPTGPPPSSAPATPWWVWVTWLWGIGAAVVLARDLGSFVALHRAVRSARPAPAALREATARLARSLGMRRSPRVAILPAAASPMAYAPPFVRPVIVLPSALSASMSTAQLHAVLAHELAHLRRGDHRVRWLELAVRAGYWWFPLVGPVCRRLREAEEHCCDAWVLWALPSDGRAYADALVETVAFLSKAKTPTPALASGVGRADDLKGRLTMIMRGRTDRTMTWRARGGVGALAALVLPALPVLAQDPAAVAEVEEAVRVLQDERAALEAERAALLAAVAAARDPRPPELALPPLAERMHAGLQGDVDLLLAGAREAHDTGRHAEAADLLARVEVLRHRQADLLPAGLPAPAQDPAPAEAPSADRERMLEALDSAIEALRRVDRDADAGLLRQLRRQMETGHARRSAPPGLGRIPLIASLFDDRSPPAPGAAPGVALDVPPAVAPPGLAPRQPSVPTAPVAAGPSRSGPGGAGPSLPGASRLGPSGPGSAGPVGTGPSGPAGPSAGPSAPMPPSVRSADPELIELRAQVSELAEMMRRITEQLATRGSGEVQPLPGPSRSRAR